MADFTDPNTWTTEYAAAHCGECLVCIRETNQLAIRQLRQKNYAAGTDALDSIRNGLLKLQDSGQGDYRKFLFSFCMAEAIVIAYSSPADTSKVIALLENARDFASKAGAKKNMEDLIGQIRSGTRIDAEDFNQGIWVLEQMNDKLKPFMEDPQPVKPQPKASASKKRAPVRVPSVPMVPAHARDPEFDDWLVENNITEDDLRYIKNAIRKYRCRIRYFFFLFLDFYVAFLAMKLSRSRCHSCIWFCCLSVLKIRMVIIESDRLRYTGGMVQASAY